MKMSFQCPECERYSLRITHSLELAPDSKWDEITLQHVSCSHCRFEGAAVYYESRRGALDSEIWHHTGYRLGKADLKKLKAALRACPARRDPHCQCPTHLMLGMVNEYMAWDGLRQFELGKPFPMNRAG